MSLCSGRDFGARTGSAFPASATRRLVPEMPEIRVVGLSRHAREDMAAQMRAAGVVRYLVKDSPIEEIAAACGSSAARAM